MSRSRRSSAVIVNVRHQTPGRCSLVSGISGVLLCCSVFVLDSLKYKSQRATECAAVVELQVEPLLLDGYSSAFVDLEDRGGRHDEAVFGEHRIDELGIAGQGDPNAVSWLQLQ